MPIAILCAGKLREKFWRDAADEYLKRLTRYDKVEVLEIPDQPEGPKAMQREGEMMLSRLRSDDYVIALCIQAQMISSEQLADTLQKRNQLPGRTVFVIGGSLGIDESVLKRAQGRLSMSPMTFPHQLARVMLLEQLYRACKINAGERYHK